MLSDETATSKKWKNIITWLNEYLGDKKNKVKILNKISILEIIQNLKYQTLVIFSKKGYF